MMSGNSDCNIIQGNALAVLATLPDVSVDAVITDPPYSSGGNTLAAKQKDPAVKYQQTGTRKVYPPLLGDAKDQRSFVSWAALWLAECWRIAKDGAPLLLFTDWRQLPAMTDAIQAADWRWQGIVPWSKRSCRPNPGRFRNQCEYVLFASKGAFRPADKTCLPGLYDYPIIAQQKAHINSKPVPLLVDLMAIVPQGGTVLDPFIGGGTTALAALETGRKCIGIDLSNYCIKIARKRTKERQQGQEQ